MLKVRGVHRDAKGDRYFKAASHKDPDTGKWKQVTRRGFSTAAEAGRARQTFLDEHEAKPPSPISGLSVTALVTRYLDECAATDHLGPKSLFDYRHYLDDYITPWIGSVLVRDVDAEVIATWQITLATKGAKKTGRGLSPNTIRLARAPLSGAFAQAVTMGPLPANALLTVPRPKTRETVPKHWSPEQAREFLALHEGDRLYPVWAFLLGSGLRTPRPGAQVIEIGGLTGHDGWPAGSRLICRREESHPGATLSLFDQINGLRHTVMMNRPGSGGGSVVAGAGRWM